MLFYNNFNHFYCENCQTISTIGIVRSLRKNNGCLILIVLSFKHKANDLAQLYSS